MFKDPTTRGISLIFPNNIVAETNEVDSLHHRDIMPTSFYASIRIAINLVHELDSDMVFRVAILSVWPQGNNFCPKYCCYLFYLHMLVGMCERFPLSEGERLNPKIKGDIHITKFPSKYLGWDLKP